jgi:signal transduction histidine kinase
MSTQTSTQGNGSDLILVVDDTETNRYRTARVLRRAGFRIIEADSAQAALRMVRERQPRLVVLDVNLPDQDGWEVCRQIKGDPSTASVLVLQLSASYVSEADTVRALDGGADGCLTEPVEPPVLVATVRSLLRARNAEEQLRAALAIAQTARDSAEAANRAKDQFLAVLSHELRSPLQGAVAYAHLLRQGNLDEGETTHALEVIERSLRQQVALVNDLLDVSRIAAGKLGIERGPLDLDAVLTSAIEQQQPAAEAKGLRLEYRSLVAREVATVLGDRDRLLQVVVNLVGNAVKFTPEHGTIVLELDRQGPNVVVRVRDTGEGIDSDLLPYIFDPFRQADSSNLRRQGGLGLGLALVRSIVAMHAGTVTAESAGRGRGATFVVRLPAVRSAIRPEVDAVAAHAPAHLDGITVLVVEDDPDARGALRSLLELAGARTHVAGSASEALAAMAREPVDVVVSDIAMPDEDGYSLVSKLRGLQGGDGRRLVTVALTGHASESDRDRALEAGFDAHVSKPIEPDRFVASVASLVADRVTAPDRRV